MKKFLALALASVMAVSLVACGSTNADTNAESSAAATTTAAATESGSEEPGLKIAIVSSPSGVDDGSFNQDNYNGVLKFIEENPNATVTPIREETGDSAAAVQAVADVVADYDVIVCCGFQFAGIGNLAQENPDTKFILIDSWPTIDGTEVTADQVIDNVYAAYYAEQESGFYAGMAAALSTTTGKVAVVNGIAYPSNVNYQYGFECGVKYVNGTEGMNVEVVELPSYAGTDVTGANVGGNYVGNFSAECTCNKARKVAYNTASDRNYTAVTAIALFKHRVLDKLFHCSGFRLFSFGYHKHIGTVARRNEFLVYSFRIKRLNNAVGNNGKLLYPAAKPVFNIAYQRV